MNILFLPIDDLRPELGCYGHDRVLSPNIDRLAAEGMVFNRAYCQQAVCGPSRVSVLSGCRPDTTRVYDLKTRLRDTMPDVVSLPQFFKQRGYETVSVGKVYHHRDDDPQGWSCPPHMCKGDWKGRGYLTDEALEDIARNSEIIRRERPNELHKAGSVGPAFEAADVPDDAYQDGRNTEHAMTELERLAGGDKPFFLAMGTIKPHLPFSAPKRYWDLYKPEDIRLAANPFEPESATAYSLTNFGELRSYFGIPPEGPVPEEIARKLVHGYWACVSYMDALVGKLLDKLDGLGIRDETAVLLWGDHGWKLGEHASWCKHTNFEIDARAPMILSAPGMRARGQSTDALVEFVDMYPTLADVCGFDIPAHCQGRSFKPLLDQPDQPWKEAALNQYPRGNNVMGYAMRTDRHRYIEWQDRDSGEVKARELYDHHCDPQENVNIADNADQSETVADLSALLRRHRRRARIGTA